MRSTILSYGGGTNSTALLIEWIKRGNTLDAVIFADTGSEQPYTYGAKPNRLDWLKREIETQTNIFDYMESCEIPEEDDPIPCVCYDG